MNGTAKRLPTARPKDRTNGGPQGNVRPKASDLAWARRRFVDEILDRYEILRANGDPKHHLGPYAKLTRERFKRKAVHFLIEYYFWSGDLDLRRFLDGLESTILRETLEELQGNQMLTAKFLGMKPTTLCMKLKKFRTDGRT